MLYNKPDNKLKGTCTCSCASGLTMRNYPTSLPLGIIHEVVGQEIYNKFIQKLPITYVK